MCDINFILAGTAGRHLEKTAATVRHYADTGLLPYTRTLDGVRLFRLNDVLILKAKLKGQNDGAKAPADTTELAIR
jgi:DNA-binding transcriptional MerR regulator